MRLALVTLTILFAGSVASAQDVAPVDLAVVPWPGTADAPQPFRYVVSLRASSSAEVIADVRLLRLEVRVPGRRRAHRCDMPGRPRRADESRARTLAPGERWAEWIDVRELCWGRSLEALETEGATVEASYEVGRGRRAWVVRRSDGSSPMRALTRVSVEPPHAPAAPALDDATAAARVTLSSADARSSNPTFRVAVYGGGATIRRAWLRPDRFRFRVVSPTGEVTFCSLPPSGRAIPDLFSRIGARRAVRFSLESRAYCGDDVFEDAGIYEVTPTVVLDEDGSAWDLDAVVGTFSGAEAAVRVRGTRGDRSVDAAVLLGLFR